VFTQGVEGRVEQQHAQRNLEVGVENDQAGLGIEVEVLDHAHLLEQDGQRTIEAEQDDEGEGQRHAGEVAGHVGEGHDEIAQAAADLAQRIARSEEHTSELQSRENLVCRLLLEKKKRRQQHIQ